MIRSRLRWIKGLVLFSPQDAPPVFHAIPADTCPDTVMITRGGVRDLARELAETAFDITGAATGPDCHPDIEQMAQELDRLSDYLFDWRCTHNV